MPSRASKKKPDFAETAFRVVAEATGQREKTAPQAEPPPPPDPETIRAAAAALSRLGASKGGKARAAALSKAKKRVIAKAGAAARWRR